MRISRSIFLLIVLCAYRCLCQTSPSKNDKLRFQAAYYLANESDSALPVIKHLRKSEPNNYQNLLLEGTYYFEKKPDLAKKNFQKACDLCNCSEALNCLASSYSKAENYDSTILVLKKSVSLNPNQPQVLASIANFYFFKSLNDSVPGDSCLVYAGRAYSLDTNSVSILKLYTHFLKYFSPHSKNTLYCFDRLAQLDLKDTVANLYVGSCLMDSGYYLKALPYITKAQLNNPKSAKCNYTLANCHILNFNSAQAVKFIKMAIASNPKDSMMTIYFNFLLENISKSEPYDSLYSYLVKGSKLMNSAVIAYKKSVDSLNAIISTYRNNKGELDSLNKLAELNYYARNYKEASECLDRFLAKSTKADEDMDVQRTSLFIEMGQLREGLVFVEAKLRTSQNNYLLFFKAVINAQLGQFKITREIFLKMQKDQTLPELNNAISDYMTYITKNAVAEFSDKK